MALIYQPAGRAGEYSEWAINVYRGCSHGCGRTYCYAPSAMHMTREVFGDPRVRPDYLRQLERDAKKLAGQIATPILLSFTCDPYQDLDLEVQHTRRTIEILHANNLHVQTLTKGGSRALRDLDLFTPQDAFASSLTLLDNDYSGRWEAGAALPQDRMDTLRTFHEAGIPTWVSLEPVINPESTLEIIRRTHEYVDLYKVGTINYVKTVSDRIDWEQFALDVVALLESLGKKYYVKDDLKKHLDKAQRQGRFTHA